MLYVCHAQAHLLSSQDGWDLFVDANWAPTLQAAFGQHWQQTGGNEVGAMLKVGRQHPSTQLGTTDTPLQPWSEDHRLSTHHHHHTSNGYESPPSEAFQPLEDDPGSISSDGSQQAAAQPSQDTMEDWANIFDQCKTAMNGAGPNQATRVPHDQLPLFNVAMTPHLYVPPAGSMAFESIKSINSEDVEDCMFGSDEDEPPELRGIKVTGLFRTSMDDWSRGPVQVQLLTDS